MYTITAILEVGLDTDPAKVIHYFEQEIAPLATHIPGVKKIDCLRLQSIPFSEDDTQPLQNIYYQILTIFESEEAVQTALRNKDSLKLLDELLNYSNFKFHWFIGRVSTFFSEHTKLIAK